MTIQFCDDFKGFGTTKALMLDGLYAQINNSTGLTEDPDPNASGTVYFIVANATDGYRMRRVLSGARTIVGVAFRLWLENLPPNNINIPSFVLLDAASDTLVSVMVDTIGRIQLWTGRANNSGTELGAPSAPAIVAHSWNHIEFKFAADEIAGTYEVRVNGVTVLEGSGDTGAGDYWQIGVDNPNSTATTLTYYIKDLVVWDSLGTENNDFLGSVQVIGRTPISDDLTGWTPSIGTDGFALLDNSPPLDDTAYLSAENPPPGPSSFGLSALPADITTVKALITQCRVRNIDGGDGNFQASLISAVDTAEGADRPMTSAFVYYEDVHELDPDTDASWTPAAAGSAKLKIDRTL